MSNCPARNTAHAGRHVVPRDGGAVRVRGVVADEHRHGIGLGKRAGPRPGAPDTGRRPTTRNARMSRSSMGPLVSASSSRPACGPGSLPAGIPTDGERPPQRRGGMGHPVGHWVGHPPTCRTAPAVKKGGALPSRPSPLARFGSAGRRTKSRTTTATNGRGGCDTPPAVLGDTPPLSASRLPCHGACHAACHGTRHGAGAPSDRHLGGGQADGGPESEAVNRPSRRRRGGRAVGELLQEDETIGRRPRTRRPRARVHDCRR